MPVTIHPQQAFVAGDTWVIQGQLSDQTGNPYDPTPASSIVWKLANQAGTATSITLSLGSGITVGSVPNWSVPGVIITVPASQTTSLSPGLYQDQLRITASGVVSTYWEGPVQVLPQMP